MTKVESAFEWVALAAAKQKGHPFACVWVRGGVAIATDGNRTHAALENLSDGNYCPRTYVFLGPDLPVVNSAPPQGWSERLTRPSMGGLRVSEGERGFTVQQGGGECLIWRSGVYSINLGFLMDACNGSLPAELGVGEDGGFRGRGEFGRWYIRGIMP